MSSKGGNMQQENLVFEGSLVEMPSEAPRCGDLKVAVAHRFIVERLIGGNLEQKTAVVLIPCPDLYGVGFFGMNFRYLIEASANLKESESYTISNDYGDRTILFWALNITKLQETKK
jgi:hypothetical protein